MDNEEDSLMMSGIQHFDFCRRQWALIHIEQEWRENVRTAEGRIDHKKCHDARRSISRRNPYYLVRKGSNHKIVIIYATNIHFFVKTNW